MKADNNEYNTKTAKPFSSRWSEFRSLKKVKTCKLSTPVEKARIVQKLMESPHTKALLEKSGSIMPTSARNKLRMSEKILASIKTALTETKADGGMNRSKKVAHKSIYQAAMAGISHKYKLGGQMRTLLHVRCRVMQKKWWIPKSRKVRKDRLPSSVIQKVENWFISTAVAREVTCK